MLDPVLPEVARPSSRAYTPAASPRVTAAALAPAQEEVRRLNAHETPAAILAAAEADLREAQREDALRTAEQQRAALGNFPEILPPLPLPPLTAPGGAPASEPSPPGVPRMGSSMSSRRAAAMAPRAEGGRVALARAARRTSQLLVLASHDAPSEEAIRKTRRDVYADVGRDQLPVRTAEGSEALLSTEEQFRQSLIASHPGVENAAGLPLASYQPPGPTGPNSLPPMDPTVAQSLGGSQRSQVEAAVLERTRQLTRLFEDQVKKQYEVMKKEVAKLALAHQKDVQGLDERFKAKMAGLASRLAAIEAAEARMRALEQENEDMKAEVERMHGVIADVDKEGERLRQEIRKRDVRIEELLKEIEALKARNAKAAEEEAERQRQQETNRREMEAVIDGLKHQLERKRADLLAMQKRLVSAKTAYDEEVVRKQREVTEMEGSLSALQGHTAKMANFASQIQGEILKRETDMKVQLGLMKNTIAFALFIDEALQIDLTDPQTTKLFVNPVVVSPSGVTYSRETLDELVREANAKGVPPVCPVSGKEVISFAENQVVNSILSRYVFKQQVTNDVMVALHDFQRAAPAGEQDQPLEEYLKRMKEMMAKRLEEAHQEQLAVTKAGLTQQIELKKIEFNNVKISASELEKQLQETKSAFEAFKKEALGKQTAHDDALAVVRDDLSKTREEAKALHDRNAELLTHVSELGAKLQGLEEGAEDDAEPLTAETSNPKVHKVRKAEVIRLQAENERLQKSLDEAIVAAAPNEEKIAGIREQLGEAQRELSAQQQMTLKAKEESEELHQRLKKLQGEQASAANDIKREQLKNDQLRKDLRDVQENCEQKGRLIPELELKVKRLEQDSSKLRDRLAGKETLSNEQAVELTKLQEQLAELNSAAERNERSLTLTREQALEAKQAATTAEEQQALLRAQHELLQAAHEKKKAEAAVLADKFTKADAACQVLQQRLRESGKDPEASLELRPLKDVQRAAGVHDTLRPMPNIQVLNELNATIVDFQEKLKEPRTVIKKMHEVTILEVDDSLPPEEEPASARSGAGQLLTSRPVSRGGDLSGRPVSRGGQPAGSVSPRPVSRVGSSRLSRPVSSRGDAKGLGLGPLGDSRPLTPGSPRVEVE